MARCAVPPAADLAWQLPIGRIALASAFLVAPETSLRAFGVDTATARRVAWLTRMMAVRDAALGVGGLVAARRGGDPVPWLLGGAASDAVDGLAIGRAIGQGRLGGWRPRTVVPGGLALAAVGVAVAVGVRRRG